MALSKILPASQDQYVGARNIIINGNMAVSQRGMSAVTVTTSADYRTVDRWKSDIDGSAGHDWSHEQSTDGPTGFGYSSKITVVTNGTQPTTTGTNHQLYQLLEKQDVEHLEWGTSDAKTVTFSFYVKSSVTGDHGIRFIHYGSSTNPVYNTHYTINTANTWERKTLTITGPTTGGITSTANSQAFIVEFKLGCDTAQEGLSGYQAWETTNTQATKAGTVYLPAASGATWQITGVQLEVGNATPFEHEPFSVTLQKCFRYYQKSYSYSDTAGTVTNNGALWTNIIRNASNQNYWQVRLNQEMRTNVSVTTYSTTSGVSGKFRNVTDNATNDSAVSNTGSSGFSIRPNSGSGQDLGNIIAVHWVADAEL